MQITYAPAYPYRHVLDSLANTEDREQMEGPYPAAHPSWFYRDTLDCHHHAILVDGKPVGNIDFGLSDSFEAGRWETGFFIASAWRRKGIIEKSWQKLSSEYGPNFSASCWEDNLPCTSLLTKLGFELHVKSSHEGRGISIFKLNR